MANQVFDRHLQAIGGAAAVATLTSFTAKGTYEGFDTAFEKVPVEHLREGAEPVTPRSCTCRRETAGASTTAPAGWLSGPDTPDSASSPHRRQPGSRAPRIDRRVSRRRCGTRSRSGGSVVPRRRPGVQVLQASENGQPVVNLYFDESGMLVRLVRWTVTPVGFVPTQIDYSDFRDVAGRQDSVSPQGQPDIHADDGRADRRAAERRRSTPHGSRKPAAVQAGGLDHEATRRSRSHEGLINIDGHVDHRP